MRKQVYISADYDRLNGDQDVVNELNKWGNDSLHKIDLLICQKWCPAAWPMKVIVVSVI